MSLSTYNSIQTLPIMYHNGIKEALEEYTGLQSDIQSIICQYIDMNSYVISFDLLTKDQTEHMSRRINNAVNKFRKSMEIPDGENARTILRYMDRNFIDQDITIISLMKNFLENNEPKYTYIDEESNYRITRYGHPLIDKAILDEAHAYGFKEARIENIDDELHGPRLLLKISFIRQ